MPPDRFRKLTATEDGRLTIISVIFLDLDLPSLNGVKFRGQKNCTLQELKRTILAFAGFPPLPNMT
jgi:hypothetical protein